MLSFLAVYLARATLTQICSATVATQFPVTPEKSRKLIAHRRAWETLDRSVKDQIRLTCMRSSCRMSLFLKRWEYINKKIKTAERQRRDHEVDGMEMRCRTGIEEAIHIQCGQERSRMLHPRARKRSHFFDTWQAIFQWVNGPAIDTRAFIDIPHSSQSIRPSPVAHGLQAATSQHLRV